MAKIGLITFSDGRKHIHDELLPMNLEFQDLLVKRLVQDGHTVITADELPWTNELARNAGKKMAAENVDATIFHYAMWSWPHFTTIAAQFVPKPILCLSNINPSYPGLVGMLASSGALDNIGVPYTRVFGNITDDEVYDKVRTWITAASAVNTLRGSTYGLFGGRPMGMYTATVGTDVWMKTFGVDVEHVDQWEIVRRAEKVSEKKTESAFNWLQENVGQILYDGNRLTPEILKRQIRSYYAVKEMIDEMNLDFCGIKAQPELTQNFCTMDIAEAFLNDPYDFDGPKDPIVCSTEADMDAALTMQLFKLITGTPVLFADVRHYYDEYEILDLVNSGQHATYFAGKSLDFRDNLPKVTLYPESFYFPAGGAAVHHLAAPGEVTLARLGRKNGQYWLAIIKAEFVQFDSKTNEELMRQTQVEWPHAFARLQTSKERFIDKFPCNHIHGVYGDCVQELKLACELLGIPAEVL